MWLLNTFLKAAIRRGRMIVTDHDGKTYEYGAPEDGTSSTDSTQTRRSAEAQTPPDHFSAMTARQGSRVAASEVGEDCGSLG